MVYSWENRLSFTLPCLVGTILGEDNKADAWWTAGETYGFAQRGNLQSQTMVKENPELDEEEMERRAKVMDSRDRYADLSQGTLDYVSWDKLLVLQGNTPTFNMQSPGFTVFFVRLNKIVRTSTPPKSESEKIIRKITFFPLAVEQTTKNLNSTHFVCTSMNATNSARFTTRKK